MKLKIPYLIPRLNYKFSLKDLINSLYGVFKAKYNTEFINQLFNNEHIYFTNHARTGLRMLLNSLDLKPKARIGVQIFNCHTVFNAIKIAGFIPVFIDVDSDFRINIEDLEKKRGGIDALIVTHTFGIPADINAVKRIISDKPIIEDCAHAFLSRYNDKLIGLFGDAAVFSIGKGKFPSIGSGGFVVINNKEIILKFERLYNNLQNPGVFRELINIIRSVFLHFLHKPIIYGVFTSTILRRFISNNGLIANYTYQESRILKSNLSLFNYHYKYIDKYCIMQRNNLISFLSVYGHNLKSSIYSDRIIFVNGFMIPLLIEKAEQFVKYYKNNGIEIGRHFSGSINWAKQFGYEVGSCPKAEQIVSKVVTVPCYYNYKSFEKLISIIVEYENTN